MKQPGYDLRPCEMRIVAELCAEHHGYGSAGNTKTYAFAVYEDNRPIAAFSWRPPPPGAAKSLCPVEPGAVLSLSRMVAVDRADRRLNHISKPLRRQMRVELDRGRWPVLVTYSDESLGHNGHVYKCSGWQPTLRARRAFYLDAQGRRVSSYSNGKSRGRALILGGYAWLQRWEHRVCPPGEEARWMADHGWARVVIPGKVWRSGNQAHTWERVA